MNSTSRSTRLMDRPAEDLGRLLAHPAQVRAREVIGELVAELRAARTDCEFYDFQRELAGHVHHAQEEQAAARKSEKREKVGKVVPPALAGSWRLEVAVWDRIVRQLRSVGDALAWRLFGFDRRFVIALSQSSPPSPIVGKEGLGYELGYIQRCWEDHRRVALLHDLTNSIRIGDATVFTDSGPMIAEVKKGVGSGSRHSAQMRRVQRALEVINDGAPVAGTGGADAYIETSALPLKIYSPELGDLLSIAKKNRQASVAIRRQQVITTLDATPGEVDTERLSEEGQRLKDRAFRKAGLDRVQHVVQGHRIDSMVKDSYLAPLSIFPLPSGQVADLIVDYACFECSIGWDKLAAAFLHAGFEVETLLERRNGELPDDVAVLHDARANVSLTLHNGILGQLLHELVEVDRFVAAVAEQARRPGAERRSTVLVFSNERAVWR